jgi:hypothetical protein
MASNNNTIQKFAPSRDGSTEQKVFTLMVTDMQTMSSSLGGQRIIGQMFRVCDGCNKTISSSSVETVYDCSQCKTTFDLCDSCVSKGVDKNVCPSGYGCKE